MSALLAAVNRYAARRKQGPRRERENDVTDRLHGTWKLVSAVREEIPSGATTELFGAKPQGVLNYSPEGRMIALIAHGNRKAAASGRATPAEAEALYRSMLSYAGDYTVAGDVVTHRVDISWNESLHRRRAEAPLHARRQPADPLDATVERSDRREDERAPDDVGESLARGEERQAVNARSSASA